MQLDYFLRLRKFARSLLTEDETTPAFSGEFGEPDPAGGPPVFSGVAGVESVAAPAAPGPIGAAVAAPDGGRDVSSDCGGK